jgi:chaperonin cofactor prefoldin
MPSTYDPLLRLELQATGENATTWGTKTNNNIELIAAAIAGISNLTVISGDTSLTTANAADDQARSAILFLTGSPVSTANLIVPSTPKTYAVIRNTTGSASIVIKQAAGTGATLPPSGNEIVVCTSTTCVGLVGGLVANVSALDTRVAAVSASVSALQVQLNAVSAALTSANNVVSALEVRVSTVSTQATNLQTQVNAVSAALTSANNVVSALEVRVSAVSTQATNLQTQVNNVSAALTSANNVVSALEVRVSSVSAQTSALQAQLSSVSALVSTINALNIRVTE